jgi:hypothetical protein
MNLFPYPIVAVPCHNMPPEKYAVVQSVFDPQGMNVLGNGNIDPQRSLSMSFIETAFSHQKEALELRHKCNIIPTMKKSLTAEDNKSLKYIKAKHTKMIQGLEIELLGIQEEIESDERKIVEFNQITVELANCAIRYQPIPPETMLKCREEVKNADMLLKEKSSTDDSENQDQSL